MPDQHCIHIAATSTTLPFILHTNFKSPLMRLPMTSIALVAFAHTMPGRNAPPPSHPLPLS
jgi:hypothetical protein